MTRDQLDAFLDQMAAVAGDDPSRAPGLITVETDHWIDHLSIVRASCSALSDGLRYRNIRILVSRDHASELLSRAEAGDRGAPYRDLLAVPNTP